MLQRIPSEITNVVIMQIAGKYHFIPFHLFPIEMPLQIQCGNVLGNNI